jgi:hypothetical protein
VIQVLINQSIHSGEDMLRGCIDEVIDIAASQAQEKSPMSLRRELKKLLDGTRPDLTSDAQSRLGIVSFKSHTLCFFTPHIILFPVAVTVETSSVCIILFSFDF